MMLEVRDAVRAYGGVRAVDDASFTVEAGSVTGLIGPNGAGKSTMIDLISGFTAMDSGKVSFDGADVSKWAPHRRARAGLIRTFQATQEWGSLTAMENVLVAALARGGGGITRSILTSKAHREHDRRDRDRARDILTALGLNAVRNEKAANLSGGQKRLLELARIQMVAPKMVLLDEPLAGVNPVLFDRIAEVISELRRAGSTVLLVEHNLEFVEEVCAHIVVMALGKNIASGTLAELRQHEAVKDAYLGAESTHV
jgi:ABC-type branched-subunit amino acid transport system ATPase component